MARERVRPNEETPLQALLAWSSEKRRRRETGASDEEIAPLDEAYSRRVAAAVERRDGVKEA